MTVQDNSPTCVKCGESHPPIKGCGYRPPGTRTIIAAEDGKEGVECPVCGRDFDNKWRIVSHGGDAWGGSGTQQCPTEGCEGRITVQY
jgi:hypothetical protein